MARQLAALDARRLEVTAAVWGTQRLLGLRACAGPMDDGIRVVAGRHAIARALADTYGQPVRSRLSLYTSSFAENVVGRQEAVDARLAAQGVRLRAVYQLKPSAHVPSVVSGVQVRHLDLVPVDMVVVDDQLAVLPLDPDRPGRALMVVTHPALVRLSCVLAESCWSRAEGAGDVR
jgi:hypothetical protein